MLAVALAAVVLLGLLSALAFFAIRASTTSKNGQEEEAPAPGPVAQVGLAVWGARGRQRREKTLAEAASIGTSCGLTSLDKRPQAAVNVRAPPPAGRQGAIDRMRAGMRQRLAARRADDAEDGSEDGAASGSGSDGEVREPRLPPVAARLLLHAIAL
jgi:hypothetical protein